MATSGSVNHSLTRNEIIRDALLDCNALAGNANPTPDQITDAARRLNNFVKMINERKPLFGKVDYTIPLYDDVQSYTIGSDGNKDVNRPVSIDKWARSVTTGGTTERPIEQLSRHEFMSLATKSANGDVTSFYYDPQLTKGVLYVWPTSTTDTVNLTDGSTDNFTQSATTTEYYYTGSDITANPGYCFINNSGTLVEMTEGTVGSLAEYEYGWGDNDTLGDDTLYVYSATDPDAASGNVKAIVSSTPNKIIITANRPLEDFDASDDTADFPQEAYEMLVANLAYLISRQYCNAQRRVELKAQATQLTNEWLTADTESGANLTIVPRRS